MAMVITTKSSCFLLSCTSYTFSSNQPNLRLINNISFLLFFLSREQLHQTVVRAYLASEPQPRLPRHPLRAFASALVSPEPLDIAAVKMIGSLRHGENTRHVFLQPKIM